MKLDFSRAQVQLKADFSKSTGAQLQLKLDFSSSNSN